MRYDGEGFRRRTRWRNELFRAPDVWPLVGVAIVLLIVMMIGTPGPHHGWAVDLVHSKYARKMPWAVREDAMRVMITRDGKVYFGYTRIGLDDLPEKIKEGLRAGAEKRVYVRADGRARYKEVREVLDEVSLAGVEKVSFLTD